MSCLSRHLPLSCFGSSLGHFCIFSERDNPDEEMASNYNTVPNSMWMTLLNLSGEAPLCQDLIGGKVATGILGLFATGVFGIPIGILGAGFEEIVAEENEDNKAELGAAAGDKNKPRTAAEVEQDLEETSAQIGSFVEDAAFIHLREWHWVARSKSL